MQMRFVVKPHEMMQYFISLHQPHGMMQFFFIVSALWDDAIFFYIASALWNVAFILHHLSPHLHIMVSFSFSIITLEPSMSSYVATCRHSNNLGQK